MKEHKRILGILYVVSGSLQILGLTLAIALFSVFFPWLMEMAGDEASGFLVFLGPLLSILFVALIILIGIPSLICGIGLLNNKSWSLTLALILGCIKLLSFPLGTLLGIYSIWVYSNRDK